MTSKLWLRMGRICCLIIAVAVFPSCTAGTSAGRPGCANCQWPQPPLQPRIKWVKEIRNYNDAGIAKGFWQGLFDLVTGETNAGVKRPYGIFMGSERRLFIVDPGRAVVHLMDLKEGRYSVIGKGSGESLQTPIALTEDDRNFAYITDSAAGRILRYSILDGSLTLWPTGSSLGRPTGIAWNGSTRTLYVTDTAAHQVIAFDSDGKERSRIGSPGSGAGQFHYPTDLFVDSKGRLFVTDALNARIQIFSPDGTFLRSFGQAGDRTGEFAKPKGVAVDSDGHVYVCDALFDAVQIFDETGQLLLVFGSRGAGSGELWMPSGIHIDNNDTIYVADAFNQRVQVFQYLTSK